MSLEEIFTCQVCFMAYDDGSKENKEGETVQVLRRKPYLIPCGHTFC